MDYKQKHKGETVFKKWFLNNRFSIVLVNILLFFLIIWVFNKISFVLNPAWVFFRHFCQAKRMNLMVQSILL